MRRPPGLAHKDPREGQTRTLGGPRPRTKTSQRERREKERHLRRNKGKREIGASPPFFRLPPLAAPTFRAPTFFWVRAPTLRAPHPSDRHLSDPTFSGFGPPPFGPPLFAPPFGPHLQPRPSLGSVPPFGHPTLQKTLKSSFFGVENHFFEWEPVLGGGGRCQNHFFAVPSHAKKQRIHAKKIDRVVSPKSLKGWK